MTQTLQGYRLGRIFAAVVVATMLAALAPPFGTSDAAETCPNTSTTTGWTKIDQPSGEAVGSWGSLTYMGTTLHYSVNTGYFLELCVKSGSQVGRQFHGPFEGPTSGTITIAQNYSHVSYRVTERPFTPSGELAVEKTADAEYDRTVTWELDKTVDPASHSGQAGDEFESTWTVEATKTDSGPGNFRVTGDIDISNNTNMVVEIAIEDVLGDETEAVVTCPETFDGTLDPDESVQCTYVAEPSDDSATENTVTVTALSTIPAGHQGTIDPASDTAEFEWVENLDGDDEVTLGDERFEYSEPIDDSTTEEFDETFTCPTDASLYTNNRYEETFVNTATLTGDNTDDEASAEVDLVCQRYQGLTPGFWKQSQHFAYWTDPYRPHMTLQQAGFTSTPTATHTLLQALNYQGNNTVNGAKQNLLRAAVAALLNAAHPDVAYPLTTTEVIDQVNAALATNNRGTILALKDTLDAYNNYGGVDLKA